MAVEFKYLSEKFYNEYRNDDGTRTFPSNLGEFTTFLQGNQGELVKVIREIEFSVTVNELRNTSILYDATSDATYGLLISESIDWKEEGLFDGAVIDIFYNRGKSSVTGITLDTISGIGNCTLRLPKASLSDFKDGKERTDIVIRLTTAPQWLTYKYGTIDVDATNVDFRSQIDGSEQAYYTNTIASSPSTTNMRLVGNNSGSDLTTTLSVSYDGVVDTYFFQYTIEHTFRIPFYVEGELGNLMTSTIPRRTRPVNMKYCVGFYFGGDSANTAIQFEDVGTTGNVGYFGENFNGRVNNYGAKDYAVSNTSGTGKIEATEVNTITFTIEDLASGTFSGGETIILSITKLPSKNDAEFKTTSWANNWLFDSVRVTEGGGSASSGRLSNATATLNGGEIDVSVDLTFSSDDQDLLTSIDSSLVSFTLATQDLSDPDNMDRSTTVAKAASYSKNPDITGIVTAHQPDIYPESQYDGGTAYSNFNGYDGDLLGLDDTFTVDLQSDPLITGIRFAVVADNGTDYFELYGYSFPITSIQTVTVSGNQRQILDIDLARDFNIPTTELINRASVEALSPGSAASTQNWQVKIGFQIPWREWIANGNVPTTFIDYTEENNNQNNRTSNYSGVSGYTIKTLIRVETQVSDPVQQQSITTYYELFSDSSAILGFDDAGVGTFSLSWEYFQANGDAISNIATNENIRIDAKFAHTLGTLSTANLFGYIWILPVNGTGQPWFLSDEIDETNVNNALQPTDTLMTGNTQFVEVISTLNQVILRCRTNKDNITLNQSYKIYARLYPK